MSESVLRITIDSRNAEQNARNLSRELNSIEKNGDFATKSMDSMSVATRSLAGYMAGIVTISGAIAKADGYTQMSARIRNATKDAAEYDLVQNRVLATAQTTYRNLGEAQEVYLSLSGGMKSLGKTTTETLDLVDSLSFSFTHNATRTDQAQSAMDALSKSMAKGKIDADAWISIVTGADNIIADMAKTTGMSEAEIRKLGASGKISLEDLLKTLIATRDQNEKLASSMENSFQDGLTNLSNAVTVYLGKANEATSATGILAGGLGILAENIETVANVAMLGGVAYLTKTIVAQTIATQSAITTSIGRRAAMQAEMAATVQATALEIQRSRQIVASTLTEINLARQELNSATTRQARAAATMRLTQAEIAHNIAMKGSTAAIAANTAAQNALNASRAMGARMLALVGGPIGAITLGVTALAAGYMYISSKGNESNEMLESQSQYAAMAADELTRLNGAQRKAAEADLSKEVGILNDKLKASENQFEALVEKVLDSNSANAEAKKIWSELRAGAIGVDEAYSRLNQTDFVTNDQINQLTSGKKKVDENRVAVKSANEQLDKVQSSGANAKKGFKDAADGAKDAQKEVATLNKDLAEFNKTLQGREFDAQFSKQLLNKGLSEGQTKAMLEVANAAREKGLTATKEMYKEALRIYNLEKGVQDTLEARSEAERKITKEKEKQTKLGQRLVGISGNSGIGTGAHLDVRYGGSRDGQKVSKEHLARLQAGGKSLSNYRVSSDYGKRKAPTAGASSFHKGIDFAMPVGTPITTKVAVKDVKTAYDSKGGGYYSTVTFEDGVVLKLLHQAPSMLSKVGGGASDGTLKSNQDIERQAEQQANTQLQLQMTVATERKRIETQLQKDIEDINKAGFSPDETKRLIAEYQAQAESEIAIAEYALKTKLDDYSDFQKSESDLLKKSFDEKKFYASQDIELSKEGRAKAVELLDEQYKQELALIELAKEERIFQMQQSLMSANAASEKYWNLERDRVIANSKLTVEEKQKEIALINALQNQEKQTNLNNAIGQWGQTEAEMRGTGDQYQLEQTRRDRESQSAKIADSEYAILKDKESDPNADMQAIAEEREAIWQAHHDRMQMIETNYNQSRAQLQLQWGQSYISGAAGVMAQVFGENSKAYQAMFMVQKAYAVAEVMLNAPKTYSSVLASASAIPLVGPFIAPGLAVGAVALQMAQAAAIGSVSFNPAGFADGGFTGYGGKYEVAGVVHKGEGVLTQEEIRAIGGEQGFNQLRQAISSGYADGGLVKDTNRVGINTMRAVNHGYAEQAIQQANAITQQTTLIDRKVEQPIQQHHYSYTIQAMDGKDVERVLKKHKRHVAGSVKDYARNFGRVY